jgi:hypothetical protein
MSNRYRICPYGTGWKVQKYLGESWTGTPKWGSVLEFNGWDADTRFFKTESEARGYITDRIKKAEKIAANKAKGCYEWPPNEESEGT